MAGKRKASPKTKEQNHDKKQKGPSLQQSKLTSHFTRPAQKGHGSKEAVPVMPNDIEEEADPPKPFTLQAPYISEALTSDKQLESCSSSNIEPPQATSRDPLDFFSTPMPLSSITEKEFLGFLFNGSPTGLTTEPNQAFEVVPFMSATSNKSTNNIINEQPENSSNLQSAEFHVCPDLEKDVAKPEEKNKAQKDTPRYRKVILQSKSAECGQPDQESMENSKCDQDDDHVPEKK